MKYTLIADIISGGTPKTSEPTYWGGNIPWLSVVDFNNDDKFVYSTEKHITEEGLKNSSTKLLQTSDIIISARGTVGALAMLASPMAFNQSCFGIRSKKNIVDNDYLFYLTRHKINELKSKSKIGNIFNSISIDTFNWIEVDLPSLPEQKRIASILSALDNKIALNRQINQNLEALARQLYDYWFVQFDFPDANGKPYKSSGGKMVYNPIFKREIPDGWEVKTLSSFISKNNTGDWGKDEDFEKSIQIGCVRGADIVTLCNLPTRYIKNNPSKLLQPLDIVIEISGGSPTQATGRSAFITEGVISRNGGAISCSNFCHAFTMKNVKKAPYFFYLWRTFYDNDIMFNYEGKTSGLKNFMTDTFLANTWFDAPDILTNLFYEKVMGIFSEIDNNIAEILSLTKQRDELLPLLMNGQINFDLSAY